jgi:hypothetical protein
MLPLHHTTIKEDCPESDPTLKGFPDHHPVLTDASVGLEPTPNSFKGRDAALHQEAVHG